MRKGQNEKNVILRLNRRVDALCGLYSRIAKKLGVDRSYVSRVARGERHSQTIERALITEFRQLEKQS